MKLFVRDFLNIDLDPIHDDPILIDRVYAVALVASATTLTPGDERLNLLLATTLFGAGRGRGQDREGGGRDTPAA